MCASVYSSSTRNQCSQLDKTYLTTYDPCTPIFPWSEAPSPHPRDTSAGSQDCQEIRQKLPTVFRIERRSVRSPRSPPRASAVRHCSFTAVFEQQETGKPARWHGSRCALPALGRYSVTFINASCLRPARVELNVIFFGLSHDPSCTTPCDCTSLSSCHDILTSISDFLHLRVQGWSNIRSGATRKVRDTFHGARNISTVPVVHLSCYSIGVLYLHHLTQHSFTPFSLHSSLRGYRRP